MKRYVLIVAGGKGLRMGHDLPKQFIPLAGKPVLMHTLECFYRWDESADLILVLPEEHQSYWKMLCRELNCPVPHSIASGGDTRFQSVKNGLSFVNQPGYIAVHDGVRPFVSQKVINECFDKVTEYGAVIPVVPLVDSIREKETDGESRPADRSKFVAVQTPQVFDSRILLDAYRQVYDTAFTDDASVVEAAGHTIYTVAGNVENIKITTPFDLLIAEALLCNPN